AIQGLIYPLRGWDFLHFYLPNAFRIYTTGQIPNFNELNFLPVFKPPANALLYSFGFYITQSEQIHLIPILYLAGTVFLCYKVALQAGFSRKVSLIATIFFLATPFTYFLVYEFQYYQEVYIMFFTTASFYFIKSMVKEQSKRKQLYYALLSAASLTGCVLSKISGYILIFVVIIAIPSDRVGKIFRSLLVLGIAFQVIRKAIFDVYLGTGIFVGIICIYLLYLIYKSPTLDFSYYRWVLLGGIFLPASLIGGYWILHVLSIPGVKEYLTNLYVNTHHNSVILHWEGISLPETVTYLENAHTATFLSSSFSILLATMFAGTWLIYKIFGFVRFHRTSKDLLIWLLLFYAIWQSFFAMGSIRYLSPILVPLSILVASGFDIILQYLNSRDNGKRDGIFAFIFSALTGFLFLYPFVPIEYIFVDFHLRYYYAHTKLLSVLGYVVLFNAIFFMLIWKEQKMKLSINQFKVIKRHAISKITAGFFIGLLVIAPIGAQLGLLMQEGFNIKNFQEKYCWYTRTSYIELINAINVLGYPDSQVILTVNTAGLEYYTSQPVLDLYMMGFINSSAIKDTGFPLATQNVTKLFEFFNKYKITIFVSLNTSNDWYAAFLKELYGRYYLFQLLFNTLLFKYRFGNEEFILFTINSFDPYVGPVDLMITDNITSGSLLSNNPYSISFKEKSPHLSMKLDLTSISKTKSANITIVTSYSTLLNSTVISDVAQFQIENLSGEKFVQLPFLELNDTTTFVHSIQLVISYQDSYLNLHQTSFMFLPTVGNAVNITMNNGAWTYQGGAGFLIKNI
ncbi:MAG: ArnT family glycosyltransferase, partial [Candidatus Heimdallarchaeaceae archaeon]